MDKSFSSQALNPRMGLVELSVADLERSLSFYTEIIGLAAQQTGSQSADLGVEQRPLLRLYHQPGALPQPRSTGLYHFALLLPTRQHLGVALRHLLSSDTTITGYADHAVSEAIYLTDPDGHGIEIYRDRPRAEWAYPGGTLRMTVDPLDVRGVLAEGGNTAWAGLPDETIMGHVHLQVADIATTETFFTKLLGFERMVRYGPSATFLATDGYHHHIGANTWQGAGLPPAPETAARLIAYTIHADSREAFDQLADRLAAAGQPTRTTSDGLTVVDPAGLTLHLVLP